MKRLLDILINTSTQRVIFPFYHSITPSQPAHFKYLFNRRHPEEFEKDIKLLLNYFDPIHIEDFVQLRRDNRLSRDKYFLLSFDDGYSGLYDYAAPILSKYRISATFFLNPAFVDNKRLFHRCKASILADQSNTKIIKRVAEVFHQIKMQGTVRDLLLSVPPSEESVLDNIADWAGVDFGKYLIEHQPYLTTTQIKELANAGFSFGGHGIDHTGFKELQLNEQIAQAEESVCRVQQLSGQNLRLFAFPYDDRGVSSAFFNKTRFDASFGTAMLKKDCRPNHYQRLDMEKTQGSASSFLTKEYMKYLLKVPLGRHKEGKDA